MQTPRAADAPVAIPARRSRLGLGAAVGALALAALAAAMTDLGIKGHWQGLFLLRGKGGAPFELKDDLVLGDGSRVVAGVSFSRLRRLLLGPVPEAPGVPWLELDFDEREGSGMVRNHLADGAELVTLFARYEDSEGGTPQGLFVGGALPDVAADAASQNESGMAYRDARGWHHVWCNVNEAILDASTQRLSYPSAWKFLGARVLIADRERVVLESSHEIPMGGGALRMDRYAYFKAGRPWFKLGLSLRNTGEEPQRFAYAYGDEPWVGEFGSAKGNVGWTSDGVVRDERTVDPVAHRWAGILDEDSGIANFISWVGGELPDLVYFSNHPGRAGAVPGTPLNSNEVFIGLQWNERELGPGGEASVLLSLGLAPVDPATGVPALPQKAGPR